MFPKDCDRMSWDILVVSCAAAIVTADEVETWRAWAFFLRKSFCFWKGTRGCSPSGEEDGIASVQGHRRVQALGPQATVEDFQQLSAPRLVQALGLQL